MKWGPSLGQSLAETGGQARGFDLIRLVAATAVVFHHAFAVGHDAVGQDLFYKLTGGATHSGLLAVSVFFVLSGFLVAPGLMRERDSFAFAIRRCARIFPGLILVVLISALVIGPVLTSKPVPSYVFDKMFYQYMLNIATSMQRYLPGVAGPDGSPIVVNGALWSLRYEVICYILLIIVGVGGFLSAILALVLFLLLAIVHQLNSSVGDAVIFLANGSVLVDLMFHFYLGVLFYILKDWVCKWMFGLTALVLLLFGMAAGFNSFRLAVPALTALAVIYFGVFGFGLPAVLRGIDLSYGIYLWHGPILAAWMILAPPLPWVTLGIVITLLAGSTALLSWSYVEKPSMEFARSWLRRRRSRISNRASYQSP